MPTRHDMTAIEAPFVRLVKPQPPAADDRDEIISQLQGLVSDGCAKREAQALEISRLQEIAAEWQGVANDKQALLDAARDQVAQLNRALEAEKREVDRLVTRIADKDRIIADLLRKNGQLASRLVDPPRRAERDPMTLEQLRGPEGGHARNCACVHCSSMLISDALALGNGAALISADGRVSRVKLHDIEPHKARPHAFNIHNVCARCGCDEQSLREAGASSCAGWGDGIVREAVFARGAGEAVQAEWL